MVRPGGTVRRLFLGGEELAIHAILHAVDRLGNPWVRRRRLSPYVLLIAEAAESGADHAAAVAVARRLLRQPDSGALNLRRLQRAARTHVRRTPGSGRSEPGDGQQTSGDQQ
jgi:hypothetical protein